MVEALFGQQASSFVATCHGATVSSYSGAIPKAEQCHAGARWRPARPSRYVPTISTDVTGLTQAVQYSSATLHAQDQFIELKRHTGTFASPGLQEEAGVPQMICMYTQTVAPAV